MPLTYRIFPEKKLVVVTGEGRVTLDDLLKNLEDLASDPDYEPPMKKLVDHRASDVIALPVEESKVFAERKRELLPRFKGERCALVVTYDVDFGMGRMQAAILEPHGFDIGVFRSLSDALSWLGVELEDRLAP